MDTPVGRQLLSLSISAIALVVAPVVVVPGLVYAQQPIRIGATMSETGAYATQGVPARAGYLLCQKHVNEKGGLLGRKVEFLIYDDQSNSKTAIALYEKLIVEDKVDAVMGPWLDSYRGRGSRDRKVPAGAYLAARRDHLDLGEGAALPIHGAPARGAFPGGIDR